MVDVSAKISGQALSQPINNTFQPGKNVEDKQAQQAQPRENLNEVNATDVKSEQVASKRQSVQEQIDAGQVENNPEAQRGSLVDITV